MKSKNSKIAVFVVMTLMIVGMAFIVRHNKKVSQYNDSITPHHVLDTVSVHTLTNE